LATGDIAHQMAALDVKLLVGSAVANSDPHFEKGEVLGGPVCI